MRTLESGGATAAEIAALLAAAEDGEAPELLRKQLAGLTGTEVS